MDLLNIAVIIPCLNPDEKLIRTVSALNNVGFSQIIIVNDGSDSTYDTWFERCREEFGCILLQLPQNRGKGAALKVGFCYVLNYCEDIVGVVTVDADGQHLSENVAACCEEMLASDQIVLGVRDFSKHNVPLRSRLGNTITSGVFRLLCGIHLKDTQTGLRAIPRRFLSEIGSIRGDRYEYETNMLLEMKRRDIDFLQVPIESVYLDNNRSSHFQTVRDSIRIYGLILRFLFSSLLSAGIDILLFYLISRLLGTVLCGFTIAAATVFARTVSSLTNYFINKNNVFENKQPGISTFFKYYALAIPQMTVSMLLVYLLSVLFSAKAAWLVTLLKFIVDTVLFFISFRIQHSWVFRNKKSEPKTGKEKKKRSLKKIIHRIFLCLTTFFGFVILSAFSFGLLLSRGPSPTVRDLLVLSATQASATKWLPSVFLSQRQVDQIIANSKVIAVNSVSVSDYSAETTVVDEWSGKPDGMQYFSIVGRSFKAYVLLLKDPARIYVATSSDNFKTATAGARIFDIAKREHAVAAINGGEFYDAGGMGSGAAPMGLTYSKGKAVWNDGLNRTFIGFDKNNRLHVAEGLSYDQAQKLGIRDSVCFQNGNILIRQDNGQINFYHKDKNTGTAQRTAIGQRQDGTVIMIVTDGRSAGSLGATHNDMVDLMHSYGAVNAALLDGGSSAMMYYKNFDKKYNIVPGQLDKYQQQGLVNKYRAFSQPRTIPTYFVVAKNHNQFTF